MLLPELSGYKIDDEEMKGYLQKYILERSLVNQLCCISLEKHTRDEINSIAGYSFLPKDETTKTSKKDDEFTVVPFYSLPGKISGFLCCTGDKLRLNPVKFYSVNSQNPGIALINNLMNANVPELNDIFVLLDPSIAVRTYLKHLDLSSETLPVVAIKADAATPDYLRDIVCGRIIIWAHKLTIDLIRHAKNLNTVVAWEENVTDTEIYRCVDRPTIKGWLNKVSKKASRWDVELDYYLQELPQHELEQVMIALNWKDNELKKFIDGCSNGLYDRLAPLYMERMGEQGKRFITFDNSTITETLSGWYTQTGKLISEGVLRIDKVFAYEDSDMSYVGRVIFKGKDYPFTVESDELSKGFTWMRKFLLKNGADLMDFRQTWQHDMISIAMKFQKPETVIGITEYGWSEKYGSFFVPGYKIAPGGIVTETDFPLHKLPKTPEKIRPDSLSADIKDKLLCYGAESSEILMFVILLVYKLLSKPLGYICEYDSPRPAFHNNSLAIADVASTSFVHDLMKRRMKLWTHNNEHGIDMVIANLSSWLKEYSGSKNIDDILNCAKKLIKEQ